MRDRDAIEAMEIGREWTITRHDRYTEFKIGNRFDAGPKVDVWWETDGSARSAESFDGDGELMAYVDKDVMGWLAHQLR